MDKREACCCFTGHRVVMSEHLNIIEKQLEDIITRLCSYGIQTFIAGGALGFDTIAAKAVLKMRDKGFAIKLVLALPCKEQAKNWRAADIDVYNNILASADEVVYVSEEYSAGCLHMRNRFMVDHSSHCVFYLTYPRGGTAYTVKYALQNELEMHNVITEQGSF